MTEDKEVCQICFHKHFEDGSCSYAGCNCKGRDVEIMVRWDEYDTTQVFDEEQLKKLRSLNKESD